MKERTTSDPDGGSGAAVVEHLFEDCFDEVFSYCLLRCGSRAVAEDVSAEVFIAAVSRLRQDPTANLTIGWLITVARRRLIDHWRRAERERRRVERLSLLRIVDDEADQDGRVLAALDSLSERQRLVLVLRYLDDLSVSEVADAMATSYSAAESLLARARRSFAESYRSHTTKGSDR